MSNELTERTESGAVPAWMREKSTGAKIGNIDASDLKPPKLKILAGMSPEIMDGVPGAQVGKFWMTILNKNLGDSVTGSLILLRKGYNVWAPRGGTVLKGGTGDMKGPLATSSDGIHWDQPNQEFEVRFQNGPTVYKWRIGKLISDYRANKFGSSKDDDPKSKPIATLTYDMLWAIDLGNGRKQQCVFTVSRTGIQPTQNFISTAMEMGVDQFYQRYRIVSQKKVGPTGDPYFTMEYQNIGVIQDEAEGAVMRALYEQYSKSGFITDMESEADEIRDSKGVGAKGGWAAGSTPGDDKDDIPF